MNPNVITERLSRGMQIGRVDWNRPDWTDNQLLNRGSALQTT